MHLIITIPAYNEENILEQTIEEIKQTMKSIDWDTYSILVQDDGSTDDTFAIAKRIATYAYKNPKHLGLASTFREEIKNCLRHGADIIVHTDADGQYPARYIPDLIRWLQQGHDLVIGSRFLGSTRYGNSFLRGQQNRMFSKIMSLLSGFLITDITSGFRAMNSKTAEQISVRSQFTYTYDQYLQAIYLKLKIAEVPIEGRKTRSSKLVKNAFVYGCKAFKDIVTYHYLWKNPP